MYRREQRHGDLPAQAGVQGGHLGRGRDRARAQDNEQDDGQHDAGQREAYVTSPLSSISSLAPSLRFRDLRDGSSGSCAITDTDTDTSWTLAVAVEFATLTLDANKKPKAKIYKPSEIDALLQKHGLGKKDEDAEMAA